MKLKLNSLKLTTVLKNFISNVNITQCQVKVIYVCCSLTVNENAPLTTFFQNTQNKYNMIEQIA